MKHLEYEATCKPEKKGACCFNTFLKGIGGALWLLVAMDVDWPRPGNAAVCVLTTTVRTELRRAEQMWREYTRSRSSVLAATCDIENRNTNKAFLRGKKDFKKSDQQSMDDVKHESYSRCGSLNFNQTQAIRLAV